MHAIIEEQFFLCDPRRDRCYAMALQTHLYNNRGAVFFEWSVPRSNIEDNSRYVSVASRVEAGPTTSTVVLRVVGGDEKGTQCLGL
jgi:hypothetical protein